MKQLLFNHLKNVSGWRSKQKYVAIVVDDYGSVRVNSKKARQQMDANGIPGTLRFDRYDTLETTDDLSALFSVLDGVKDAISNSAVFTPYALSCNVNFEAMAEQGYLSYISEDLPETFSKLESQQANAYTGTWNLWKQGMEAGLLAPQFHGREHFHIGTFNALLAKREANLLNALKTRSLTGLQDPKGHPGGWTAAFGFYSLDETASYGMIIEDGVHKFQKIYGYRPQVFTPPAQEFPLSLEPGLTAMGLEAIDKPFIRNRNLGDGHYKREFNTTKKGTKGNPTVMVRNVVFEPTDGNRDHVGLALKQIDAAFTWNRPAIISSHRVNFCGHIDEKNRKKGLEDLEYLLRRIRLKWPDIQFVPVSTLLTKMCL